MQLTKKNKRLILLGLCLSSVATMYLISGSAIFSVAVFTEFGAMEFFGLVFVIEALARSIALPISGKLGDIIGRKRIYMIGVAAYIVSVVLCGSTSNVFVFLALKALIGFSWGLFFSNTFSIVSDIYDKEESPKYLGYLQTVNNGTLIFSPVLTGLLVDQISWRINFYVGLPFLIIAFLLVFFNLPKYKIQTNTTLRDIDFPGIFATVLAVVPLSIYLALRETSFDWRSLPSVILILLTAIGIILLFLVERKAADPLFPIRLLKNRFYMTMFFATSLYAFYQATSYYIPLYIQTNLGYPSTIAGLVQMPSFILAAGFSMICGFYIAKRGIDRLLLNSFWIICLLGGLIFFSFLFGGSLVFVTIASSFMGMGMGFNNVIPISYTQTKLAPEEIGTGISFINFAQGLSTSLGSSVCSILVVYGADKVMASSLFYAVILMVVILFGFRFKN